MLEAASNEVLPLAAQSVLGDRRGLPHPQLVHDLEGIVKLWPGNLRGREEGRGGWREGGREESKRQLC